MANRDEIIAYCDNLLEIHDYTDYCPNGLQVPGAREVKRVVTGVSSHMELLEAAAEDGADLVLAHHGLFWNFHPRALSDQMAARLRLVLEAGINVAGYHLPLDAHPGIGNNVLLAQALGIDPGAPNPDRFAEVKGSAIGVIAHEPEGLPIGSLLERLSDELGREPLHQGAGPEKVSRIGVVTGSAAGELGEAIERGLDAFITGEPAEHAMADAKEGGIHFIAAGHYATETFGIRRLGEMVAERFGVEHRFIDIPNPV